jgi:hypothetical protein
VKAALSGLQAVFAMRLATDHGFGGVNGALDA